LATFHCGGFVFFATGNVMTKHRTAGRMGRLGRKKTLRGGAFVTSMRKKILAAPSEYKTIVVKYLQAWSLAGLGRREGKHPNEEVFKKTRDAAAEKAGFIFVKAAWDKVVAAQKALSAAESTKIKNVNAAISPEMKKDPIKKAAYLSGATSAVLTTLGVILSPFAAAALFTAAVACAATAATLMVPIAVFDCLIGIVVNIFGGNYEMPLANLNYLVMGACVGADLSRGGQRARRGGGPEEALKAAEELAKKGAAKDEAAEELQDALTDAGETLLPLQKAYNAALLEGISALQGRYGKAHSDKMGEVMTLPDFARIEDTKEDISTKMAIGAVTAAMAKEPQEDDPDEKPEDKEAFAKAQIASISSRLGKANAKAPPARAPEAEPAAAPEPEPAPEVAAPEPAADDPKCWTYLRQDAATGWGLWVDKAGKTDWGNGENGSQEPPDGGSSCATGGRRGSKRGGSRKPTGKAPPAGGRSRKTRKSTRGRRR